MRTFRAVVCLVVLALANSLTTFSEENADWLTQSEQDFFSTFGIEGRVDGKRLFQMARLSELAKIADGAKAPLSDRIRAIDKALQDTNLTIDESKELQRYGQRFQFASQMLAFNLVADALAHRDPIDSAVDATNGIARDSDMAGLWELQHKILTRVLDARDSGDKHLDAILNTIEQRSKSHRGDGIKDVDWSLEADAKSFYISGQASFPMESPIMQVTLHRKPINSFPTATIAFNGLLAEQLGMPDMARSLKTSGLKVTAAQERAMKLPLVMTAIFPNVKGESKISLSFPLWVLPHVEKVDVKLWTSDGVVSKKDLPGLAEALQHAQKLIEEERERAIKPLQKHAKNRMEAARDKAALTAYNQGKSQLSAKRFDAARASFQRAIEIDADSPGGKLALQALEKLP